MGFGGGGSGSFVLPNHKHTNVLADGGELEELVSLIDGITLKAWLDAAIITAKGTITSQEDAASAFTTTSATYVDITGFSITVPNDAGKSLITSQISGGLNIADAFSVRLMNDTTALGAYPVHNDTATANYGVTLAAIVDCDGQVVKTQLKTDGGATYTIQATFSKMYSFEVLA